MSIFYPYLDDFLSSFNERFKSNSNLITSLSCLLPSKIINSTFQDVQPALAFHKDDLSIDSYSSILRGKFELWQIKWKIETIMPNNSLDILLNCPEDIVPNTSIYILLNFFLILPVTTPSVERNFSTLKRIKTYLRIASSEDRLNSPLLINIHMDLDLDAESILDFFAYRKERRLNFKL